MLKSFLKMAVLATLACSLAGCATPPHALNARILGNTREEPVFFSDEASVSQIQSAARALLPLQHEEYQVGPDDVLEISVFEWEEKERTKTLQLRVSELGIISLPSVGPLRVAGRSVQEIQRLIEKALVARNVLQEPRVGVWVSEFRSRQISVIGAVSQPGSYAIHQNVSSLLSMLSLAGGPLDSAANTAYVIRSSTNSQETVRIKVDLEELLHSASSELNLFLVPGDVVYLPRAPHVYVYGAVRQPGAFTFRKQLRILESVAIAGGVTDMADSSNATLIRRTETGKEQIYLVNLSRIESGRDPNVFLRDGDILRIPESPPKKLFFGALNLIRGLFTFSYRLDK
jgi:polysaccharide export outer membrane protein